MANNLIPEELNALIREYLTDGCGYLFLFGVS